MANLFQRLLQSNEDAAPEDPNWLNNALRTPAAVVSRIDVGSIYLFQYEPKHAQKLPYYDTQPLVIPFDTAHNGFKGLNLHYIPPRFRAILMDEISELLDKNDSDPKTKLNLTYDLLKQVSRSKYYIPCVKHYLDAQVRSRFVLINPDQWMKVLMMPLARFQKLSTNQVYAQSNRKLK